jgi:hypothetical protein
MRITITQICGPSVVSRFDGAKLREEIERRWSDAEPVEIDFERISIASISFLDEAIAILGLEHPVEVLKRRLKLINILDTDRRLLNTQILARARTRAADSGEKIPTPPPASAGPPAPKKRAAGR